MKKTVILMLVIFLLASCGKSITEGERKNTQTNVIEPQEKEQSKKTENVKVMEEKNIKPQFKSEEKKIEKKGNNKKLVKEADGNVYLYENGKKIDYLTSKAYKKKLSENCYNKISYTIINAQGDYGVVKKEDYPCEAFGTDTVYAINLNNNEDTLTELYSGLLDGPIILANHKITIDWATPMGEGTEVFDLKKELPNKKITTTKEKINQELPLQYTHSELTRNGYKLNKIGDIKEYYKKVFTPSKSTMDGGQKILVHKGFTSYNTIYVKGSAVLDFSVIDGTGTFLNVNYPQEKMGIDLYPYGYDFVQPIFGGKGKKVIIQDMNTIKVINTEMKINKVIWKRGKGFTE